MENSPIIKQTANESFTCSICSKSLGSRKSQVRHISYCRRTRFRLRSRKRACFNCTKAKTHCDVAQPSCSRCMMKSLVCEYAEVQPMKAVKPVAISPASTDQRVELAVDATTFLDFAPQLAIFNLDGPYDLLQQSGSETAELLSLDSTNGVRWNLDFSDIASAHVDNAVVQPMYQYARTSPQLRYFESCSTTEFSSADIADTFSFDRISLKAQKSFAPRRVPGNQFSLNRKYVLCILRSYPYMILPGKSLPPFLHPQCMMDIARRDGVVEQSLPGPLAICAAIVQMFSAKNESNAIFIWKAIRMEQERLFAESSRYDAYYTIAALQAVTIYFLLRLSEQNDEATNFDLPLIDTMMHLAFQVKDLVLSCKNPSGGRTPLWKIWALTESLRRTIIVPFIIDLLADYSSTLRHYRCDQALLTGMPLPCSRDLWNAPNNSEWRMEYTAQSEESDAVHQLTYGDLLNSRSNKDNTLDSWLSQLDDMGTLVMAAASLPGNNA